MRKRANIRVMGIVQGVGMRPHVYSLAGRYGLSGWVLNDAQGVEIEVEGPEDAVRDFTRALEEDVPPLAKVTSVKARGVAPTGEEGFEIRASSKGEARATLISPDACVCGDCLREMRDPGDRRHNYAFINCTNCGPRYTIIRDIPYDREKTTMAVFEMCGLCRGEYEDPSDRRFHAQPVACPACGPEVFLTDASGTRVESEDPVGGAREALAAGKIVAVKGLGGFHLAVNATDEEAVRRLRLRKAREEKPLAVMSPDAETVRWFCEMSAAEERLLASVERPIVLLRKKGGGRLARSVAPRNGFYGVMLPYTPLHELLLRPAGGPPYPFRALVMTSGNLTDEPICYENGEALERLGSTADLYLMHNRDIHIRADDSIARVVKGEARTVRRARGYVPRPVFLKREYGAVLAAGADMKNTVCILRGREAFLSQHVGDLKNAAALAGHKQAVEHLARILEAEPELAACDQHPAYASTRLATGLGLPVRRVQHHHAHTVSCLAENGADGPVIGVALDGTGYGADGAVWGGEFLIADRVDYRRAGHLEYVALPGGDRAAEEPWRMALAYLYRIHGPDAAEMKLPVVQRAGAERVRTLVSMMERGVNSPPTSSAGRLFDAAAAIIGLRDVNTYEGQAACELEGTAARGESGRYGCRVEESEGVLVVKAADMIEKLCEDIERGTPAETCAARFQNSMIEVIAEVVLRLRESTGLEKAALSGGVWQNARLLAGAIERLEAEGLTVYSHRLVPTNDGGVSLGQAVVAGSGGGIAEWV